MHTLTHPAVVLNQLSTGLYFSLVTHCLCRRLGGEVEGWRKIGVHSLWQSMADPRDGYEHTKPRNYISVGKEFFVQGAFGDVIDACGADSWKRSLMSGEKKKKKKCLIIWKIWVHIVSCCLTGECAAPTSRRADLNQPIKTILIRLMPIRGLVWLREGELNDLQESEADGAWFRTSALCDLVI